jgi:hypothetical protein
MAVVSRLQLVFLSATWVAGIYVNGFVPIVPGTSAEVILLNPAVESHVVLATLSAATSVFILALAWAADASRRQIAAALLAALSIVLAGDSGLAFVLGGGSDSAQSMIMATAFVTALFLTFLSMTSRRAEDRPSESRVGAGQRVTTGRAPLLLCCSALLLFYAVFVTGIYANLFVVGPVFSLPRNSELAAFTMAEHSAAFVTHEALGGALLLALVLFSALLWSTGTRKLSLVSAGPALLVAYSAYVGSLNLTSPPVPAVSTAGGPFSMLVPMLSAAGFMAAIVITMLLALKIRGERTTRT